MSSFRVELSHIDITGTNWMWDIKQFNRKSDLELHNYKRLNTE